MTKVLGFKKKEIIFRNDLDSWLVRTDKLVPVVSVEEHEKELAKVRSENIDKWLKKKGGLLDLSETIIISKIVLKIIEKMPKSNSITIEWLEKWCKENRVDVLNSSKADATVFVEALLSAAKKEAGK